LNQTAAHTNAVEPIPPIQTLLNQIRPYKRAIHVSGSTIEKFRFVERDNLW
jgi:hypothetical protein